MLQAIIVLQNDKLSIFKTEIKERDYLIEKLEHQLANLRRHEFGAPSEALDQLELTLEDEEIAVLFGIEKLTKSENRCENGKIIRQKDVQQA